MLVWAQILRVKTLASWLLAGVCAASIVYAATMAGAANIQGLATDRLNWLLSLAAGTIVFLLITTLAAGFIISRLIREKRQARTAVDNMSQGLGMFDASGRLVLFNTRYADMYSLSVEFLRGRPMLRELLEQRKKIGKFKGNPQERMNALVALMREGKVNKEVREADAGRIFSIANWPAPGGGWVSTHDDITEQRQDGIERDRLAAQEKRRAVLDSAIVQFRGQIEKMLTTVGERSVTSDNRRGIVRGGRPGFG